MIVPPELKGKPPSPKLVYVALSLKGPLTASEIESETALPKRTVHRALGTLIDAGVVSQTKHHPDTRATEYRISST